MTLSALALGASACELPPPEEVAEDEQAIIGGITDQGDPAVVMVGSHCSGTLIADTVVLTAEHCGGYPIFRVHFGTDYDNFFASRSVSEQLPTRYVNTSGEGADIMVLRLSEPAPEEVTPIPFNTVALDDSWVNSEVRAVGFGYNDGVNDTGFGTKRTVTMLLRDVQPRHLAVGDATKNICSGDSGGPLFLTVDGTEVVAGTVEQGGEFCDEISQCGRVDRQVEFLTEVVDAWSGPCKQDGTCVTEGCRTTDPDCDPCGLEGTCATGCEKMDLDCPIVGFDGDPCETREDCESLLCIEALEDPRVTYCSQECDPDRPEEIYGCLPPLTVCAQEPDGRHLCRFADLTPGVQGAPCTEQDECRSGYCYPPGDGICVEECGGELGDCPEAYVCENIGARVNACILPKDEGCCLASAARSRPRSPLGGLLLVGLAVLLLAVRKIRIALPNGAEN